MVADVVDLIIHYRNREQTEVVVAGVFDIMYPHNSGQIEVVAVHVLELTVKIVDTERQWLLMSLTLQSKQLTQRGSGCCCR